MRTEREKAPALAGRGAFENNLTQRHFRKPTRPNVFLQRQAEALHARGPRPVGELLAEILDRLPADDAAWLRERLERYNEIAPETYAAVGARHFPAAPLREVS